MPQKYTVAECSSCFWHATFARPEQAPRGCPVGCTTRFQVLPDGRQASMPVYTRQRYLLQASLPRFTEVTCCCQECRAAGELLDGHGVRKTTYRSSGWLRKMQQA